MFLAPKTKSEDKAERFKKPQPEEVAEYAKSIQFKLDGNHFVNYYESRGWLIGKVPMKDWKAAVRTWKANDNKRRDVQYNTNNVRMVL